MVSAKLFKIIGRVICYVLFALGIIYGAFLIAKSGEITTDIDNEWAAKLVTPAIYISMVAIIIAILSAVVLPLFFNHYTKKQLIKAALIVVGVAVLFIISWVLPNVDLPQAVKDNPELKITDNISHWVGVGMYFTYFVFAGAIITIVYAAISNLIQKGN